MTLNMLIGILEQGLIYGIMAMGLLITYRILDFPDLTVDSSFPLGAAVSATLTLQGVAPWLTLLIGCAAGGIAGLITGLIHVKCRVRDLLSGIITMTGLYSINLHIAQNKANLPSLAAIRSSATPSRSRCPRRFPLHHAHHHPPDCADCENSP